MPQKPTRKKTTIRSIQSFDLLHAVESDEVVLNAEVEEDREEGEDVHLGDGAKSQIGRAHV